MMNLACQPLRRRAILSLQREDLTVEEEEEEEGEYDSDYLAYDSEFGYGSDFDFLGLTVSVFFTCCVCSSSLLFLNHNQWTEEFLGGGKG